MDQEPQVQTLYEKHHALEEAIAHENQRPAPDGIRIQELKREKLRLKDEIARISA